MGSRHCGPCGDTGALDSQDDTHETPEQDLQPAHTLRARARVSSSLLGTHLDVTLLLP